MKKNLFERTIMWYKNGLISFNMVILAIFMTPLFFIFPEKYLSGYLSFLAIFIIAIIMLIINMLMEKTSKKYFIEIPKEKDNQCEDYLLLTKEGEIFKMDNQPIWSPGGKLIKIKGNSPNGGGKWRTTRFEYHIEKSYVITTSIKEILGLENIPGKIEIELFLKDNFNPLLIYKSYQENNKETFPDCLYIDEILIAEIIKENQNNESFKYFEQMNSNQCLIEKFMTGLIIPLPKLPNVKNYAIYQKRE